VACAALAAASGGGSERELLQPGCGVVSLEGEMIRVRRHRGAATATAGLLVIAVLVAGCGVGAARHGRMARPPATGHAGAAPGAAPGGSMLALESLTMVTPRIGWAMAVDRDGYPVTVVRTIDGGRVWRAAGPAGLHGQGLRVAFYGACGAWATWSFTLRRAWPVTYRTTNCGRTWHAMGRVPVAAIGASAPDMVTRRLGWVTAGLGAAGPGSGIAIFRTTDGGRAWRQVELTTVVGQGRPTRGAIPFGCAKGFAMFSSATTGWVAGSCAGGSPGFWVSRDGGGRWRRQRLPRPSGAGIMASCQCGLTGPVFSSPADGALWAGGLPGPPALAAAAYLTRDGGRTWHPIRLPGGRVPLQAPDFTDPRHGFVIGGTLTPDGTPAGGVALYGTADGGATWTARSAIPLLGQATLDFLTPEIGFATAISYPHYHPHLLRTSDGGATWTAIPARLGGHR
jgi:photosystem II stability/assembly factor-like uncharacterized protein